MTHDVIMGLVCFRLKVNSSLLAMYRARISYDVTLFCAQNESNDVNAELMKRINDDGRIHMVPSEAKDVYFLRFVVNGTRTQSCDVTFAWKTIVEVAEQVLLLHPSK